LDGATALATSLADQVMPTEMGTSMARLSFMEFVRPGLQQPWL
jgi:hypothetical protein